MECGKKACLTDGQGGASTTSMKFVGNGQGGYERLREFNHVGKGGGDFVKSDVVQVTGWRLKIGPVLILGILCILAVWCITKITPTDAAKESNAVVGQERHATIHTVAHNAQLLPSAGVAAAKPLRYDCLDGLEHAQDSWPQEKRSWCCRHEHRGCVVPLFDCSVTAQEPEESWSQPKTAWCCKHRLTGCPTTTALPTTTSTSTTALASRMAHAEHSAEVKMPPALPAVAAAEPAAQAPASLRGNAAAARSSDDAGCDTPCVFGGRTASCRARIQSVAEYAYAGNPAACALAFDDVQAVCTSCRQTCSLTAAQCLTPPATAQARAAPPTHRVAVIAAEADPPLAQQEPTSYDCTVGLLGAWPRAKGSWCCIHEGRGCGLQ